MKRYPAYKDSGVEWLGMVPEGWGLTKVRYVASFVSGGTPARDNPEFWNGSIPWVSPKDMKTREIFTTEESITEAGLIGSATTLVEAGAVLMVVRSGILKHTIPVAMATATVSINQDIKAIAFDARQMMPAYFAYFVEGHNDALLLVWSKQGATVESIEHQYLTETRIPLPSLPEQRAIADFLDREVAKIDDLVAEQRRLIALLAEKRQAVISLAVTRGLNPDAPIKSSGIDWLGDIPEGWEVKRLKFLAANIKAGPFGSSLTKEMYTESGFRVYGQEQVIPNDFSIGDYFISERYFDEMRQYEVCPGDILISCVGSFGRIAVAPSDILPGIINPRLMRLRCAQEILPDFLATVLRSSFVFQQLDKLSRGGTMDVINIGAVKEILIATPPREEQLNIVASLAAVTDQFDALSDAATSAINLLQERRAALISAAVTGKIDLREAQGTNAQNPQSLQVCALVAGTVIASNWRRASFGRVKLQKLLYLAQAHAGLAEIGGDFLREAAGPLDRDLREEVETALEAAGAISVEQEKGAGTTVRYKFLGDAVALRADLSAALGDRMQGFLRLIDCLGGLDTRAIEAVATLYAAWNDLLIDGESPRQSDIIHEVLENWHPEKRDKFTADDLGIWLDWMRRQDIVPSGKGRKTHTGRLFV